MSARNESRGSCLSALGTLFVVGAVIVGIVAVSPQMDLIDLYRVTQVDPLDGQRGTGGDGYTFMATTASGAPLTWPCEGPIEVEVNPEGAPDGYAEAIDSAFTAVEDASGFTFEVVGETTDRDFVDRTRGPVLLGWADEDEVPELAGQVAGLGGAAYVQGPGGKGHAVGGMVVLDTERGGWLRQVDLEALLAHELAHVLGLGHTDDPGQLMTAVNDGQTEFGAGDVAGLQALREEACS